MTETLLEQLKTLKIIEEPEEKFCKTCPNYLLCQKEDETVANKGLWDMCIPLMIESATKKQTISLEQANQILEETKKIETKEPKIFEEKTIIQEPKIQLILFHDKKLAKMLENKNLQIPKLFNFSSQDEKEEQIVKKLASYTLGFEEIDKIMEYYACSKWKDSQEIYKKFLYEEAKQAAKKTEKPTLTEYLEIRIEKIIMCPNKKESYLKFFLNQKGIIELDAEKTLNAQEFRTAYYFSGTKTMLKPIENTTWARLLTYWTNKHGIIEQPEASTEEEIVKEKIVEEIEGFILVDDIKKSVFYGRIFDDSESYLVASSSIETILKKNKLNIKMTRLANWLKEYLTRTSEPKRVGKKLVRYWFFKKDKIVLDNPETESEEGGEESDN